MDITASTDLSIASSQQDRHSRNAILAIFVMYVTYFGFVATDASGLGNQSTDVLLNQVYRLAGLGISWCILIYSCVRYRSFRLELGSTGILMFMYAFYGASLLVQFALFQRPYLLSVLRCVEWATCIFAICQVGNRGIAAGDAQEMFGRLLERLVIVTFLVCLAYMLIFPESVFSEGVSGRRQVGGASIHPNRLAFVAAAGIVLFGTGIKRWREAFWLFVSAVFVALAASRVGFLLGAFALVWVALGALPRTPRFVAESLGLFWLVTGAASLILFSDIANMFDVLGEEFATLNGRAGVWEVGIRMASDAPLFGWGFLEGPQQIGQFMNQAWWNATNAQNDLLSSLVSGGYTGLIMLLAFYFVVARAILRTSSSRIRRVLACMFLMYLISSQFEPLFVHLPVQPIFLILIGLRAADLTARRATNEQGLAPAPLHASGGLN